MRKQATIAAAILGLALSSGCSIGWESSNASILSVSMSEVETSGAESVLVQTEAGDIELIATDGPAMIEAHVYAVTEERADATKINARVTDEGRLEISIDWPGGERRQSESCDIVARIPRMHGVWIRTGAGEIDVKGMAGEMLIETGAGDVEVAGHAGKVTAITSAGDIEIRDASGPISAKTSAGDIDLVRVNAPITARTSAGDIHASMIGPYTGTIVADTSVGDLRVLGKEYRQKHVTLSLGDGPEICTFESSVGDVLVKVTDN